MSVFTFDRFLEMQDQGYSFFFKQACVAMCVVWSVIMVIIVINVTRDNSRTQLNTLDSNYSSWVIRGKNGYQLQRVSRQPRDIHGQQTNGTLPISSPYLMEVNTKRNVINLDYSKTSKKYSMKTIAVYDPKITRKGLLKEDFRSCDYKMCKMTTDVENADAVIFIMPKMQMSPNFKRKENQTWVFFTIEAPSRSNWFSVLNHHLYRGGMNLTITYTLNSDITSLYGMLIKVTEQPTNKDYDSIFRSKSKSAAWFVSHCKTRSERAAFVRKMKTRMDVDIFGECGTKFCRNVDTAVWGKSVRIKVDENTCLPLLSSTYKFYLAFENTLCREYVTEKFFKLFRNVDIIPVVRGGADYKKYFPSDTFVDASDFSTPERLADFLLDLAEDQQRYIQYLKKKDRFSLIVNSNAWRCELCKKLHTVDHVRYSNIRDWWTRDSCFDPQDSKPFW